MDCATEEAEIRHVLGSVVGILNVTFQLGQRTLDFEGTPEAALEVQQKLKQAGHPATPVESTTAAINDHHVSESVPKLGAALALAVAAELIDYFAPHTFAWRGLGLAIALVAIGLAGIGVYKKGVLAILRGRLNINALMSTAVTGAMLIGQWPEAAMVMALYAIAEAIEAKAVDRARNAIKGLLAMTPEVANIKGPDGTWRITPVKEVVLGSIVSVRPGERVPMDGVITQGSTTINQAPVTGESIPVDKGPGNPVFAGTINETSTFEFKVTAVAEDSTLARIIHAVEEAQTTRAPTQGFVDKFATVYTPAIFFLALTIAIVGPLFMGWPWLTGAYKALVLLVIACPCALVISTPVTIVSGLAAAAKNGILIKGGIHLENARKLKVIALDKTGTITEGKPKLVHSESIQGILAENSNIAAAMASQSDHPVSKAIAQGLASSTSLVSEFRALPGRGIQANVEDSQYILGNHRLIEELKLCSPALEEVLRFHEAQGRTVTLLASSTSVLGVFAVADTIKGTSRDAIVEMKALGIFPVMLTGDNQTTASAIAKEAGIDDARGDQLPADKLSAVKEMRQKHGPSAMIGDGINDAPALAEADIGFAMGGAGTDTAMEAADIVVMNDDLRRIAQVVRLSRRTSAILWQNISLALGIKAVFLVLAVFGNASMWMAVFADMGASLLVVVNGLRLLAYRAEGHL
jgi:Cd2+/Zn2+-exporting ATPase